jgi:hypothetical protein
MAAAEGRADKDRGKANLEAIYKQAPGRRMGSLRQRCVDRALSAFVCGRRSLGSSQRAATNAGSRKLRLAFIFDWPSRATGIVAALTINGAGDPLVPQVHVRFLVKASVRFLSSGSRTWSLGRS